MGVEPNAWSRALPVLCADLLRHWERDARFLCCQKIHIPFSIAESEEPAFLPRGAFRNHVDGASGRPRPTAGIESLRGGGASPRPTENYPSKSGGHMGPPLRLKRTTLITGSAPLIRPAFGQPPFPNWRAGEDTRPYADAGTVLFSSQGPVPDRPARIRTGSVGSSKPGAEIEPHQRQFLHTQGPVAQQEFRTATQILRAGNDALPTKSASPVMGSRGERI